MKYRILHNNPLQFYDTNAELVGTITANGSNLKISSNSGIIELGNTASDIQVGTLGTPISWTFLGGGTIGAGGIGTINMGQSGDTINMNVAGVTYQYPASFLRFNEITATNNKINITTQVPGSVVLSLPQRPVVGQLQLTDAVPSTSNLTGALTVAGGVGIAGNLSVTNATVNGQLGVSAPNDSGARLKITATPSGAVFNHADNSNIFLQTQGVNRLTIADGTGNGTLQGNLTVQGTSTSVSNTTGALTVAGGAGIRGNLYADSITLPPNPTGTSYGAQTYPQFYIGGVVADNDSWKIYAEAPITNEGRLVFQVEDDTTETFVWRAHQFYTAGGTKDLATLNTAIFSVSSNVANFRIRNTTGSTSTSSGAAIIDGGLGVAGNVYSGGVYDTGVNIIGFAGRAYNHANAAFASANSIDGINTTQNNSITAAFTQANTAVTNAGSASIYANGAFAAANSAATLSAATDLTQNNSIAAAFTRANNSISANAGGTITGDLSITGNLFVTGNTVSISVGTVAANDTLMVLGIGNYISDISDIGLAGHYNDGTNAHSGIIRDTGTKEWYLFKGYTPDIGANNNVDINHASFIIDTLNANLKSNLVTLKGYDTLTYINSAFSVANSAAIYANGAFVAANSAGVYANGAFAAANAAIATDITQNNSITASFTQANLAVVNALAASNYANAAFLVANQSLAIDTTQNNSITASFIAANSSGIYANGSFTAANNRVLKTGDTMTGNLVITSGQAPTTNTTGSLVLNGGAGIGGNFFNTGGSALYISANTFGDGGTSSGANALVYINQTNSWGGNQPWSLFVNGYSNLSGLRINGSDTPRALHKTTAGNLGFSLSDGTSVISFGPQNGTFAFTVAPPYNTGVSANNYIQVRPGNTGVNANGVFITVEGVDANSDINIVPKGINGKVNIYSTVASTSNTTGALVVNGGIGSNGAIYTTGGSITINNGLATTGNSGTIFLGDGSITKTYGAGWTLSGGLTATSITITSLIDLPSGSNTQPVLKNSGTNNGFYFPAGQGVIAASANQANALFMSAPTGGVNYLQVSGNTTGNAVLITSQGADANVDINVVSKGGNSKVVITSTTPSTSNNSGALVVNGGLGVTGNLFMSSANNFTGSGNGGSYRLGWADNYFYRSSQFNGVYYTGAFLSIMSSTLFVEATSSLITRGQIYNDSGDLRVVISSASGINVANVQASTTNTSGSLIVYGGAGIRGNVYSGGIYITGASSNGITFVDGTTQTSAGAGIADVLALSIALG